jgi:hypothetical protein
VIRFGAVGKIVISVLGLIEDMPMTFILEHVEL